MHHSFEDILYITWPFIYVYEHIAIVRIHLGLVLFGAYFPFYAREFDAKGRTKYIHITAVASAILIPALIVEIQFAMGGYRRTMVPIFCLADTGSTFVFSIIPVCLLSAVFLTLVMIFQDSQTGGLSVHNEKGQSTHSCVIDRIMRLFYAFVSECC